MSSYKLIACSVCNKRTETWFTCCKCMSHWCDVCENKIKTKGTKLYEPLTLAGTVQYNCPVCSYVFLDWQYLRPAMHKKSKACTIM